ncbi:MAG: hypothetical protein AAFN30_13205 [Actinomycetota bacterium]
MADGDQQSHWWLAEGERILRQATTSCRYQYANSPIRQRYAGTFFLTDRRFVAVSKRGRTARRRVLPIDVPREHIEGWEAITVLRTRNSYYRPWFGRRILRLDIDHQGRELTIGLVLPAGDVDAWAATLEAQADGAGPPAGDPDVGAGGPADDPDGGAGPPTGDPGGGGEDPADDPDGVAARPPDDPGRGAADSPEPPAQA